MTVMARDMKTREISLDEMPGANGLEYKAGNQTDHPEARPSGRRASLKALGTGILAVLAAWFALGALFTAFSGTPVASALLGPGGLIMLGVAAVVQAVSFFSRR